MFIQMYSGKKFSLVDPQPEDVCIDDIAHHLGLICRFNGAVKTFYSVAQHCIFVSKIVPIQYRYRGLMHDAGEAYYGDITSPFKGLLRQAIGNEFSLILQKIDEVVAFALDLSYPTSEKVKQADLVALATEKRDLMTFCDFSWRSLPTPYPQKIYPISAESATYYFKQAYVESR